MILYNVTINIDKAVEQEWLGWMQEVHVPEVMATGLPVASKVLRLLTEVDNGGTTYTFQYSFRRMEDYVQYQDRFSTGLQQKVLERYPDRFVSFRSLLEEV
ncbi:DUF4286 family protein [Larkinella soli]|uniref:DUF4286 family protein n=1 Tax=Larkinella soli TaxID=1770527 RepID=UPI000FFCB3E0|nr:DUF4286 family protein [Larkinella soli]